MVNLKRTYATLNCYNIIVQELIQKLKSYQPHADLPEADIEIIKKAYEFAEAAHLGEKRLSGDPHINHCLSTALLLAELKVDISTIAAALLHDTLEHTNITKKDLEKEFGKTIANLVDGVTIIKRIKTKTGEEKQVENLRKLLLATAKDVRVVLIRLAEKLHNLKTIDFLPKEKQKVVISKVFDIYAPLAERLGVYHFKWQLEDWAFKYQNHAEHSLIQTHLAETREAREAYIETIKKILAKELKKSGIEAKIEGRPKHIYGIYKKMQAYKKAGESEEEVLQRIYDKHATRVLVKNKLSCYLTLSVIHSLWKAIPGRFDDYSSVKTN
ncbi:MAG: bifunctional (p)ppGpp synthetase/guanosine-3',5'-bis(diphosphate) 3'-pyrophosphohydrolase [Candidatus Cloacimonetes bacterium]|nr:bifunctional (p)ppGpp synthetase/guanosine-3',5'-bis(diphosphate) 3'-pyrophosphohydrolase [Candidatus Cloacimonadota bacterium]